MKCDSERFWLLVLVLVAEFFASPATAQAWEQTNYIDPCNEVNCKEYESNTKYPDPENCEWYYRCTGNKKHHQQCQKGQLFDRQVLECRPLSQQGGVECHPPCFTTVGAPDTTVVTTRENVETTGAPPFDPLPFDPCNPVMECNGKADVRRFPNPDDCSLYYQCTEGTPWPKSCLEGGPEEEVLRNQLFDSVMMECQPARNVEHFGRCQKPCDKIVTSTSSILTSTTAEDTLESTTAEDIFKSTTVEDTFESTTAEDTLEITTAEDTLDSTTAEDTLESTTAEDTLESTTAEDTLESTTAEDTLESTTAEDTLESTTAEDTLDSTTAEDTLDSTTAEDTLESTTAEDTLESTTAVDTLESTTAENNIFQTTLLHDLSTLETNHITTPVTEQEETTQPLLKSTLPESQTTLPESTTLPDPKTTLPDSVTTMPDSETTLFDAVTTVLDSTTSPEPVTTLPDSMTTLPDSMTTLPDSEPGPTTDLPDSTTIPSDSVTTESEVPSTKSETTAAFEEKTTFQASKTTFSDPVTSIPQIQTTGEDPATTPFELETTPVQTTLQVDTTQSGIETTSADSKDPIPGSTTTTKVGTPSALPEEHSTSVEQSTTMLGEDATTAYDKTTEEAITPQPQESQSTESQHTTDRSESTSGGLFTSPNGVRTTESQELESQSTKIITDTTGSGTPLWSTTDGPTAATTEAQENLCILPATCQPGEKYPDPHNCVKYKECVLDQSSGETFWRERTCPTGELFDMSDFTCFKESGARCLHSCDLINDVRLSRTSQDALEGQRLAYKCEMSLFDRADRSTLEVSWSLNETKLTSSPGSRIQITPLVKQSGGTYTSELMFLPVEWPDSGTLSCNATVSMQAEDSGSSTYREWKMEAVALAVLAKPITEVLPITMTNVQQETVTLSCKAIVPPTGHSAADRLEIYWYRDGTRVRNGTNGEMIQIVSDYESALKVTPNASVSYSCECSNKAGKGNVDFANITVVSEGPNAPPICPEDRSNNVTWTKTVAGLPNIQQCPHNQIGETSRLCVKTDEGEAAWEQPNLNYCVDKPYAEILLKVDQLEDGIGTQDEKYIEDLTGMLKNLTSRLPLSPGNLNVSIEAVQVISNVRRDGHKDNQISTLSMQELENIVQTISNLLAENNAKSWDSLSMEDAFRSIAIMDVMDTYGKLAADDIVMVTRKPIDIQSSNLVFQADVVDKKNASTVSFPQRNAESPDWVRETWDAITLPEDTLQGLPFAAIPLSASYYKTLSRMIPSFGEGEQLNSKIMALGISGTTPQTKLSPPVKISFSKNEPFFNNYTASCSFWNYSMGIMGGWSDKGCEVLSSNDTHITCQCNHLTNFAVLMSPSIAEGTHAIVLSIISVVGCAISTLCLVLTILLYISIWKHVKSHHAVVLINLCIALIIANITFLAGINKTEPEGLCTAIAALLHYFYLAAFFMMLVEGIELMLYIVYVFHVKRKRETAGLIFGAWFVPAVIVGASLGITQLEGYGNEEFCWLSTDSGLIWAFVGPALLIICINIVILIIVLKRIATARLATDQQRKRNKVRSATWNILVIMPILGVTWIFGIFSVNESMIVFQYIFAVCNSLQGLFIFIFHALCNKRMKNAKKDKRTQYGVKNGAGSTPTPRMRPKSDTSAKSTKTSSLPGSTGKKSPSSSISAGQTNGLNNGLNNSSSNLTDDEKKECLGLIRLELKPEPLDEPLDSEEANKPLDSEPTVQPLTREPSCGLSNEQKHEIIRHLAEDPDAIDSISAAEILQAAGGPQILTMNHTSSVAAPTSELDTIQAAPSQTTPVIHPSPVPSSPTRVTPEVSAVAYRPKVTSTSSSTSC